MESSLLDEPCMSFGMIIEFGWRNCISLSFSLLECSASLVSSSTMNSGASDFSTGVSSVSLVVSVFGRAVLRSIWFGANVGTGSSILVDSWTRATQAGFP